VSPDPVTECEPCPRGTASAVPGAVNCAACDRSSFTGNTGATECLSCPPNTLSSVKSATVVEDCLCVEGYFGGRGGPCSTCPDGGYCAGMTDSPPIAIAGFWVSDDDPFTFYQCTPPEACLGKTARGNATCADGYTGRLCGQCEPLKFFRLGDRCMKCPENAGWLWAALVMCGLGGCLVLLLTGRPGPTKIFSPGIGLAFVQLVSLYHGFSVNWPSVVLSTFDAASFTNLNIELFSPECSVTLTYWSKWVFKMMVPVMIVLTFTGYYAMLPLVDKGVRMARASWRWAKEKTCVRETLRVVSVCKTAGRERKEALVAASRQGAADCKASSRRKCKRLTDRFCAPVRACCARVTDALEEHVLEPAHQKMQCCKRDAKRTDDDVVAALGADNIFAIRDALTDDSGPRNAAARRVTLSGKANPLHNRPDLLALQRAGVSAGGESKADPGSPGPVALADSEMAELSWHENELAKKRPPKRALSAASRMRGLMQRAARDAAAKQAAGDVASRSARASKPSAGAAKSKPRATPGLALATALVRASRAKSPPKAGGGARRMSVMELWKASKEKDDGGKRRRKRRTGDVKAGMGLRRGDSARGIGSEGRTAAVRTRLARASTAQLDALEALAAGGEVKSPRSPSPSKSVPAAPGDRAGGKKRRRKRPPPIKVDGEVAVPIASPSPPPPGKTLNAAVSHRSRPSSASESEVRRSEPPGKVLNAATSKRGSVVASSASPRAAPGVVSRVGALRLGGEDVADLRRLRRRRSSARMTASPLPGSPASTGSMGSMGSMGSINSSGGIEFDFGEGEPTKESKKSRDVNAAIIARRQLRIASKMPLLPRTHSEKALMRELLIRTDITERFLYAATSVGSIGYTFLASTAVEPLNCLRQPDGSYTLKAAGDVACYGDEWMKYIVLIVGFSLIYALGIPLYFYKVLSRARRFGQLGTASFENRYGVLTLPYTNRCWWWELANILRKLLVIVALKFGAQDQSAGSVLFQVVLAMLVFSGYTCVLGLMVPYEFHHNNRLALITTIASLFSLFAGVLYFSERLTDGAADFLSVLVVFAIIGAMGLVLVTMAMEKRRATENVVVNKAIGLNRYQLRAMEERLWKRLFPRSNEKLVRNLDQWEDDDRDAFLRDLQAVLRLVPDQGMELLHGKSATGGPTAQAKQPAFGARRDRAAARHPKRDGGSTAEPEPGALEWTGNKVEMVRYAMNPVVMAQQKEAREIARAMGNVRSLLDHGVASTPPRTPPPP